MRSVIFCFLLFTNLNLAFGQDQVSKKMLWYSKSKPTTNLFVHFDKNVYSNNETIYFTGYLIKEGTNPASTHKIMAVALISDVDSTVVIEDKFVMQNGLSFGNITIPDSLFTGNYRLLAYTDKLTNAVPDVFYEQPITIKTNIDPEFKASMKLLDDKKNLEKSHHILVSVTTKTGGFLPKPTSINYRYGTLKVQTKTDVSGQLLINLPSQNNLIDPNLYVNLKNVKETSLISMAIPQSKSKAEVKFYPEGGNLVEDIYSNVGWEVKDQQRKPMALKAFLYKDGKVIDTIETSSYGIGQFKILAKKNANYSVKLQHDGLLDSTYQLPKAITDGLALTIVEAAVQDTLKIAIRTNKPQNLTIRIHNFRENYLNFPLDMAYNNKTIKIPLTAVPKGLATISITDSLDRPLAERIFFAHYNNTEKLNIELEKTVYEQREKVNLTFKLNQPNENGIVSIAVVQNNRIDLKNINDIESYTYLKNELANLPLNINGLAYKDKKYVEEVLLIKGWTRYTWQDLQKIKAIDTVVKTDSLKLTGVVTKNHKSLNAPVTLGKFGSKDISLINTNRNGSFDLKYEDLIIDSETKKLYLFVNDNKMFTHEIEINDPYQKTNLQFAKKTTNENPILPSTLQNNGELVLKSNEKLIRLNEVVINSKNTTDFNYLKGANACGDYVCLFNILNCRNHISDPGNRQPIAGNNYLTDGQLIYYSGCKTKDLNGFYLINGIHYQKEFYLNDYKDPQEPAFFSTLFWNYATLLNADKETTLSFHTSDITGKFRVVVQGVTNKEVIYGEQFFEVKPKLNP